MVWTADRYITDGASTGISIPQSSVPSTPARAAHLGKILWMKEWLVVTPRKYMVRVMGPARLKTQPQRQLHGPRPADLEHRRQSAPRAARSQHQIQHRCRLPEQRVVQITHRVCKAGLVQRVER